MIDWLNCLKILSKFIIEYPKYILPFGIFSAVLLFIPDNILSNIGLFVFRNQFKSYLGIMLIFSITFIITNFLLKIKTWAREMINYWFLKRNIIRRLGRLTPEEANILRSYIEQKTYTRTLGRTSGIINGLVSDGIIYQSSMLTFDPGKVDFNIPLWIWRYINGHPELLAVHVSPSNEK